MKKLSGGKYFQSCHWESKAAIVEYIENELPNLAKKTSFVYLGAYNTNGLLAPRLDPLDGKVPVRPATDQGFKDADYRSEGIHRPLRESFD
jgi:hypothetical protein